MYAARANGLSKQLGSNPIPKFENSVFDMKYKSQAKQLDDKVCSPKSKAQKEIKRDKVAQAIIDEKEKMKERRAGDQLTQYPPDFPLAHPNQQNLRFEHP